CFNQKSRPWMKIARAMMGEADLWRMARSLRLFFGHQIIREIRLLLFSSPLLYPVPFFLFFRPVL
ncbi:Os08g0505250, partial [Oryza sativa Japonica Group]